MKYEDNINLKMVGNIWKNTPDYRYAENKAKWWIRRAFNQCEKPYLSLSGGKDSVALLALVDIVAKELNRDFILWAHISDASFPGTKETILECQKLTNRELVIHEPGFSAFDVIGMQSVQKFGKSGYFFKSIKDFSENKYDLVFTGVRAAESKRRTKAFDVHGHIFKTNVPCKITRCDGISHYTINDVAATIIKYNFPIHPIYEKRNLSNMPLRLGYITCLDLIDKETAIFLKVNYPKEFQKLAEHYEKIRNYA